MINKVSSHILSFVSEHFDVSPEMKDIYQYGIEITLSSMLNIVLVLLCSLLLGNIWTGLIYLFVFIFLRSFTGGFHASTYLRCNLTMIATFLVTYCSFKIVVFLNPPIYIYEVLCLLNLIPISACSPVPNKHKPLTDKQREKYFILSIVIASAILLIGTACIVVDIFIGAMIIMTVTMVAILIVIETFLQRRGIHEH